MASMYFFTKDAKALANKMTDPLVVLSEDMELVSNMSLGTTISHDPSLVREIRNIQETFLRMSMAWARLPSMSHMKLFEV